jgi:hypothetical protein
VGTALGVLDGKLKADRRQTGDDAYDSGTPDLGAPLFVVKLDPSFESFRSACQESPYKEVTRLGDGSRPPEQPDNQHNQREQQQQMDKAAKYVRCEESQRP